MNGRCRNAWLLQMAVLISIYGAKAVAQENASEDKTVTTASTESRGGLEEVLVTARRRTENLQDVPMSISAVSGVELSERGIRDLGGITSSVPNMEINNGRPDGGSTTAQIFIRGVGQNDYLIPNDPGVGLYLDDVYIARSSGSLTGLLDIESIEVLRGPQGTLYGKNTIGGAVRILTVRPDFDELSGRVGVTVGSYDRHDFNGSINVPVNDQVAFRLSGSSRNTDDIGKRVGDPTGQGTGNINENAARLAVRYQPVSSLDMQFTYDVTQIRQHQPYGAMSDFVDGASPLIDLLNATVYPQIAEDLGLPAGTLFDSRWVSGPEKTYATGSNVNDYDVEGGALVVTYDIAESVSLKSITAYRTVEGVAGRDGDFSPFDVLDTISADDNQQVSQEFQFNGSADRLSWTMGLYYLEEKLQNKVDAKLWDGLVLTPLQLNFNPTSLSKLTSTSEAIFGQATYDLSSAWHLTVGGRYNHETKDFFNRWTFESPAREFTCPGLDVNGRRDNCKSTSDVFTPMASISVDLSTSLMMYLSYSEGFKEGGWTPRLFSQTSLKRYDPEKLKAYEIGMKSAWLDNRLVLNGAVFYSDYKDLQLTSVLADAQGNPQPVVENAGAAEVVGVELELTAKPAQNTSIGAGVGLMDAKYTSLASGVSFGINNELPDTPPVTLSANIVQAMPLANGAVVNARLDANYKGKTYKDPGNSPYLIQSAFTLLNARLSYVSTDGKWEVAAFGTNLLDEEYLTNGLDLLTTFGFIESYYGRPREYGAELTVRF